MSQLKPGAGFFKSLQAVLCAFFGVRKKTAYLHDAAHLRPGQLIVAALLGTAVFIFLLLFIVHWVVG